MAGLARMPKAMKWIGTIACLVILGLFLVSTKRAVTWDSSGLEREVSLMAGAIGYGWRPEGWRVSDERYPPTPGWSLASYGGSPELRWWVASSRLKSWCWIEIPLWMPFVLAVVPTAVLWYRDRRSIPAAFRRWCRWFTPDCPKRVTLRLMAVCCVVHLPVVVGTWVFGKLLYEFFIDHRPGDSRWDIVDAIALILLWTTPAWAILWACGCTLFRNHLFRSLPGHHCSNCGYDLTGNVSGVCPECGETTHEQTAGDPS